MKRITVLKTDYTEISGILKNIEQGEHGVYLVLDNGEEYFFPYTAIYQVVTKELKTK